MTNNISMLKKYSVITNQEQIGREINGVLKTKRQEEIYFIQGDYGSGKSFFLMFLYHDIKKELCLKSYIEGKSIRKPLDFYFNILKDCTNDIDLHKALINKPKANKYINKKNMNLKRFFNYIHFGSLDPYNDFVDYSKIIFTIIEMELKRSKKGHYVIFIDDFDEIIKNCKEKFIIDLLRHLIDNEFLIFVITGVKVPPIFQRDKNKELEIRIVEAMNKDDLMAFLSKSCNRIIGLKIPHDFIEKTVDKIGTQPHYAKMFLESLIYTLNVNDEIKPNKNNINLFFEQAYSNMLINLGPYFKKKIPDSADSRRVLEAFPEDNYISHKEIASRAAIKPIYLGTILKRLSKKRYIEQGKNRGEYKITDPILSDWLATFNRSRKVSLLG